MDTNGSLTVVDALATVIATDATRPLLTYYDDATGERTELSGATLANWVAKTANLLVDGLGLGTGDVAGVALPPHWQTAAVLLGCWSAGLAVDLEPAGRAGKTVEVGFASADRLDQVRADETYALALDPFGLGFRTGAPGGAQDYNEMVRGYGDHFSPITPVTPTTRALDDGRTHGDLVAQAPPAQRGDRLLIDADAHPDPVYWLVAPLLAGASVVLCRNLDRARVSERLAAERAHYGGS
jgi:uncharacterized protein (TIGR03089 family)